MTAETLPILLRQAMQSQDRIMIDTLRGLQSALDYERIRIGKELDDDQQIVIVQREVKKRGEAIEQYRKAGHEDRATKEEQEREILMQLLPEQLSVDEISEIVSSEIRKSEASSIKDMGRVMPGVKGATSGRADGAAVASEVKKQLGALSK